MQGPQPTSAGDAGSQSQIFLSPPDVGPRERSLMQRL